MWAVLCRVQCCRFLTDDAPMQMVNERLQQFAIERHAKLVKALIIKLEPFVINDLERFKKTVEADVADKVGPCHHSSSPMLVAHYARLALRTHIPCVTGEITAAQDLSSHTHTDRQTSF